jgi:hypothetical protein
MEIIWTVSATEDYLRAETSRPKEFAASIDGALCLLRVFPEMGSRVLYSTKLRRILVGQKRQFGLYYGLTTKRIAVVALVDLRQAPLSIERIILERQP